MCVLCESGRPQKHGGSQRNFRMMTPEPSPIGAGFMGGSGTATAPAVPAETARATAPTAPRNTGQAGRRYVIRGGLC